MHETKYNPYQIFTTSKTPAGFYARQKWLNQADTHNWEKDFEVTVTALYADQADDGSWYRSDAETISRLFGLHLTVRDNLTKIDSALNWLLEKRSPQPVEDSPDADIGAINDKFEGLPFMPSRKDHFILPATLFLASIFERHDDPDVLERYRWLSSDGIKTKGLWVNRACSNNILRAMVVHPTFSKDSDTLLAVKSLAGEQLEAGNWKGCIPFYQTLNDLAHIDIPEAKKQLEKAFLRLLKTQQSDGSWGDTESEWNTFLSIHALRNKGLL